MSPPVIACWITGTPCSAGFVCDGAKQVRDRCRMLLDDDALAARMGQASRDLALREYAESSWRSRWIDIVDRFLSR